MKIVNKKAAFNYNLFDSYESGILLLGGEVKSLRTRGCDLSESYVKIIDNEPYLVNANIPIQGKKDYNSTRSRKLLLNKDEITSIQSKIKAKKLTLVPVKMYNKGPLIKLEIALAKSKLKFEKKESIKKHDLEREIALEFKDKSL